ncbi:hypothetical protein PG994_006103 [Apiospora phragmitis]|uniref:FAD-binding FR-type domain-containing protein n=1 Tax=Apiospora phragmitis TaxID=2905665 RepID=A0ABR1VF45_9PEZI
MKFHSVTESLRGGLMARYSSDKEVMFAERQHDNEQTTKYYAAALSGLIGVFIISHWTRWLITRHRLSPSFLSPLVALSRLSRRVLLRKIPGFSSVGHAILLTVFFAINIIFSFTGFDRSMPTNFASRFGWMASANFALVVFLALKNTPLAILTSYSYERLNPLHQVAGYCTCVYMILHAAIFSGYFIKKSRWEILHEQLVTVGIVLGFVMLAAVVEAFVLRRFNYELFYVVHVVLFTVMLITLGLHRPEVDKEKIAIITCIAAGLWGADRLIRMSRLMYNSVNNEATIHPLPQGGTQILLKKPLPRAVPGTHCFVWLPRVRLLETHPFTIVATSPTELIVNSYNGFTRSLHKHATKNPGATLKVALEGPYGTFPDPILFDKVICVAGGSGATFTFGIASNMLQKMTENTKSSIDFIWAVKSRDSLSWFAEHLNAIRNHAHAPRVASKIHATREVSSSTDTSAVAVEELSLRKTETVTSDGSGEKDSTELGVNRSRTKSSSLPALDSPDPEKGRPIEAGRVRAVVCRTGTNVSVHDVPVEQGRPDIAAQLRAAIASVGRDQRVLVAACGPDKLMKVVRNTTAECIAVNGPAVELHCEQFGW